MLFGTLVWWSGDRGTDRRGVDRIGVDLRELTRWKIPGLCRQFGDGCQRPRIGPSTRPASDAAQVALDQTTHTVLEGTISKGFYTLEIEGS